MGSGNTVVRGQGNRYVLRNKHSDTRALGAPQAVATQNNFQLVSILQDGSGWASKNSYGLVIPMDFVVRHKEKLSHLSRSLHLKG